MKIQSIEKPKGLKMKLAYALCKRRIGRVITPFKVVHVRVPAIIPVYQAITKYMTRTSRLDRSLLLLIQSYTANHNECEFCVDITRSFASGDPQLLEKVWRVAGYATDPIFSDAERAALAYVAEVTEHHQAGEVTFAMMKKYYTDTQIIEITLANAIEHFYNLVNKPLGIESDGLCAVRPSVARSTKLAS